MARHHCRPHARRCHIGPHRSQRPSHRTQGRQSAPARRRKEKDLIPLPWSPRALLRCYQRRDACGGERPANVSHPSPCGCQHLAAPSRSSLPPCSGLSRRGLETTEHDAMTERRPTLTGPARGGCEIGRSGRKNARGAGRTKEWTQRLEGRMCAEQVELPKIVVVT